MTSENRKPPGATRGAENPDSKNLLPPPPRAVNSVVVSLDDRAAQEAALQAGIFGQLAGVAPSPRGIAIAGGVLPDGRHVAVIRFLGWPDAPDNGWVAVAGSLAAVVAYTDAFVSENVVERSVRTWGGPSA